MTPHLARENMKPTVLVVDDEAGPRDAVNVILRPFFNIRLAENARKALEILTVQHIDLIVLDQKLPDRHGMDLLQDIKREHADIEVIIITGHGSVESAMEGLRHGAAGYLLKPFNVTELMTLVSQTLEKKKRFDCIRNICRSSPELWMSEGEAFVTWERLKTSYLELGTHSQGDASHAPGERGWIPLLTDILESKSRQLLQHSSRASFYAMLIGTRLNLATEAQQALMLGAFLHDIGKALPVCCGSSEGQVVFPHDEVSHRQHPEIGARLIHCAGLPIEVSQTVLHHHERWDGEGFPHALERERIPLLARIVSIVQAFDHLTTEISGRSPFPADQALHRIARESHAQFDPVLTDLFREVMMDCKDSLPPLAQIPAITSGNQPAFPMPRIIH